MSQQSGYDLNTVGETPDFLKCCICTLILRKPIQISSCGHRLCKACYINLKSHATKTRTPMVCPIDRQAVPASKVFDDLGIERMVNDLKVYCTKRDNGCVWTGELRNLDNHQKIGCVFLIENRVGEQLKIIQKKLTEEFTRKLDAKNLRLTSLEGTLNESRLAADEHRTATNKELYNLKLELEGVHLKNEVLRNEINSLKKAVAKWKQYNNDEDNGLSVVTGVKRRRVHNWIEPGMEPVSPYIPSSAGPYTQTLAGPTSTPTPSSTPYLGSYPPASSIGTLPSVGLNASFSVRKTPSAIGPLTGPPQTYASSLLNRYGISIGPVVSKSVVLPTNNLSPRVSPASFGAKSQTSTGSKTLTPAVSNTLTPVALKVLTSAASKTLTPVAPKTLTSAATKTLTPVVPKTLTSAAPNNLTSVAPKTLTQTSFWPKPKKAATRKYNLRTCGPSNTPVSDCPSNYSEFTAKFYK